MTEKTWCDVCQYEETGITVEELMGKWLKHTETESHLQNVVKYLQYDLGAMTLEEIPEKLDEYFGEKP